MVRFRLLSFSLYGDEALGLCETATQIEVASYPGLLTPAFVTCSTNVGQAQYPMCSRGGALQVGAVGVDIMGVLGYMLLPSQYNS